MEKKRVSKANSKKDMLSAKHQRYNIQEAQIQNPKQEKSKKSRKRHIDEEQDPVILANKEVISKVFSNEEIEKIKYDTESKRRNREYYVQKGFRRNSQSKQLNGQEEEKNVEEEKVAVDQQFTAKNGNSILHNLIRTVSNEDLTTKKVKKIYNYILKNYGDKVSEEERQLYQTKPGKLKLKVFREKTRRENNGLLPKRESKKDEGKNDEVAKKQDQQPPEEEQKQAKPQKAVRNLLQFRSRNQIKAQGSSNNQEAPVLVIPKNKKKPRTISPTSNQIKQELYNELLNLMYLDDEKSKESDQQEVQEPAIQNNQEIERVGEEIEGEDKEMVNELKQVDDVLMMEEPLQEGISKEILEQQCSQTHLIQKEDQLIANNDTLEIARAQSKNKEISIQEEDSFQILEITSPNQRLLSMNEPYKETYLQKKLLKDQLAKPNQSTLPQKPEEKNQRQILTRNRLSGSLLESINKLKKTQNEQPRSSSRKSITVTENSDSPVILLNKRVEVLSTTEQRKRKREQLEKEEELRKSKQLNDFQAQMYQYTKRLYPAENVDSFKIPNKILSTAELCGLQLKCISPLSQNFLDQISMDIILTFMQDIETEFVNKCQKPLKYQLKEAINLYNLNQDSVFLHVQSGCGISCLQTNLRAGCQTYGIEKNLPSLLASYWLRSTTKSFIDKIDNKKSLELYNTQFIHIDYVNLDRFAIGDVAGQPVTHIFIPDLDQELCRFNKLAEILIKTPFSMLVWPLNQKETKQIFCKNTRQLPDLLYIKCFDVTFEFGGETVLYIYIRRPTPEFQQNRTSLEYLKMVRRNDSKKTIHQMDELKSKKVIQIATFYKPTIKHPDRTLTWQLENLNLQQSKQKPKKLDKATSPSKTPTPKQKQEEEDGFKTISEEIRINYPGVVPRGIISSGNVSVVFYAFNCDQLRPEVVKISKKKYSRLLSEEYETIQLLRKNNVNADFLVEVFRICYHKYTIHQKDAKKGLDNTRAVIFAKPYPMNISYFLKQSKVLSLKSLQHLFASAAYGVREIHERGYAHGDLKPHNVLIDNNFRSVIADFGFARQAITPASRFVINGTPQFLPIEYFSGGLTTLQAEYDYRKADIWSLGVTLFFMIYQDYPFKVLRNDKGDIKSPLSTEEVDQVFKANFIPNSSPFTLESDKELLSNALDLIKQMLKFDYTKRCNIYHVVGHKFCNIPIEKFNSKRRWTFENDDEFEDEFRRLVLQNESLYACF